MKREIRTEEDIKLLVDTFYGKVNQDELLSPVFNGQAKVDWEEHLPKMYKFWGTQLIGTANYFGRPFPPHAELHIGRDHFERWLQLFTETVDELFTGMSAQMARQKARNIAAVFQYKLGLIKED
jgi:hemoglobin